MRDPDSGENIQYSRDVVHLSQNNAGFERLIKVPCWMTLQKYPKPKTIRPGMIVFQEALDFHMFCFTNTSGLYDDIVAYHGAELAMRFQVQMETRNLDPYDAISIICSLPSFSQWEIGVAYMKERQWGFSTSSLESNPPLHWA